MIAATIVVLVVLSLASLPLWWRRVAPVNGLREVWALGLLLLLGASALTALAAGSPGPWVEAALLTAVVVAAATGGGPVTETVLRRAARGPLPAIDTEGGPQVLRGGAWIGALERVGVCVAVLAGSPEAVAVVLAVKGLGRYPELRHPGASERFIIGTLASLLWATAAAGVGLLAI
ncbi:MAG TPA: hypothetical protein VFD41_06340 [Actinomycetales bacterium]|nr:hypothetical protein [Actinomycetales bacterium]